MTEFEKQHPITKKTSYSLWQAKRKGWLAAMKYVTTWMDFTYNYEREELIKEIEELEREIND